MGRGQVAPGERGGLPPGPGSSRAEPASMCHTAAHRQCITRLCPGASFQDIPRRTTFAQHSLPQSGGDCNASVPATVWMQESPEAKPWERKAGRNLGRKRTSEALCHSSWPAKPKQIHSLTWAPLASRYFWWWEGMESNYFCQVNSIALKCQ